MHFGRDNNTLLRSVINKNQLTILIMSNGYLGLIFKYSTVLICIQSS